MATVLAKLVYIKICHQQYKPLLVYVMVMGMMTTELTEPDFIHCFILLRITMHLLVFGGIQLVCYSCLGQLVKSGNLPQVGIANLENNQNSVCGIYLSRFFVWLRNMVSSS